MEIDFNMLGRCILYIQSKAYVSSAKWIEEIRHETKADASEINIFKENFRIQSVLSEEKNAFREMIRLIR